MLTILLAALQIVPAPVPPASEVELRPYVAGVGAGPKCQRATVRHARRGDAPRPRRFNELPAGRLELAVMREIDGCLQPAVIRENIGPVPVRR